MADTVFTSYQGTGSNLEDVSEVVTLRDMRRV